MSDFLDLLSYGFVIRALIAGSFVAICCSLLGVFLVLRRLSLIGDGIAHLSLGTIGVGILLGVAPLAISVPLVLLASLWLVWLTERTNVYGDAAIGVVSSLGIATGVLLASIGRGSNLELMSYLFGSILLISPTEVVLSVVLSIVLIVVVIAFYPDLFALTFDEEYARVLGIRAARLNRLLILCTALTVVLAIKVVGAMLVSSLIVLPAVTALQVARQFRTAMAVAVGTAVGSVIAGILLASLLRVPPGATIVLVNFGCFGAAYLLGRWRA